MLALKLNRENKLFRLKVPSLIMASPFWCGSSSGLEENGDESKETDFAHRNLTCLQGFTSSECSCKRTAPGRKFVLPRYSRLWHFSIWTYSHCSSTNGSYVYWTMPRIPSRTKATTNPMANRAVIVQGFFIESRRKNLSTFRLNK